MVLQPYNNFFEGRHISSGNVEPITGYKKNEWIKLSGLFSPRIPAGFIKENNFSLLGVYPKLEISAGNLEVQSFRMIFYLAKKIIEYEELILNNPKQGIGKIAFGETLELATRAGFRRIECRAAAGIEKLSRVPYNGFITCAKLGFTMKPEYIEKFQNELKVDGRSELSIQELLSTDEGTRYWKEKNITWDGEFNLSPDSKNWELWNSYLTH